MAIFTVKVWEIVDDVVQPKVVLTIEAESQEVVTSYFDGMYSGKPFGYEISA